MSELDVFMETCSVGVHPDTVAQIVETVGPAEMHLLRIMNPKGQVVTAAVESRDAGIRKAITEIENGAAVSIGVMQVSSNYWLEYDVTVFDMVEPCTNITVGTSILTKAYLSSLETHGDQYSALKIAVREYLQENLYVEASVLMNNWFTHHPDTVIGENERQYWSKDMNVSDFVARTKNEVSDQVEVDNNDT